MCINNSEDFGNYEENHDSYAFACRIIQLCGGLTSGQIKAIAAEVSKLLNGSAVSDPVNATPNIADVKLSEILNATTNTTGELLKEDPVSSGTYVPFEEGVTISNDYTTVTRTINLNDGIEGFSDDTVVTLTLTGVDTTPTATASKTIKFETFSYEFSTPVYAADKSIVKLSGTIDGYVVGGVATVALTDGKATSYDISTAVSEWILPEAATGISISYGDESVDDATVFALWTATAPTGTKTYSAYRNTKITTYEADLQEVVTGLVAANTTNDTADIVTVLNTYGTAAGLNASYSATNGGSIVYTYAPTADVVIAQDADGYTITLPAGETLTVTLAGNPAVPVSGTTVALTTYTIGATALEVSNASGANDWVFEEVALSNISGDMTSSTLDTSDGYTLAATFDVAESGVISAECPVGPALNETGSDFAAETVSFDYAE